MVIGCHASENSQAVGNILLQEDRPVACMSEKPSESELIYLVSDVEMMAVIYSMREWRPYIEGKTFTIDTDDQPNRSLDKAINSR